MNIAILSQGVLSRIVTMKLFLDKISEGTTLNKSMTSEGNSALHPRIGSLSNYNDDDYNFKQQKI